MRAEKSNQGKKHRAGRPARSGASSRGPDRVRYSLLLVKEAGLLKGEKTVVLRGRMPPALVKSAKAKTGIDSDTELLTAALANLVAADDYAEWLIAHRGSLPVDLDLDV